MMTNDSREISKELAELIYERTKDSKFTKDMCIVLETDAQKQKMIQYIKENNPSLNDINYQSLMITMPQN